MFKIEDSEWLRTFYPGLQIKNDGTEIDGILKFRAAYSSVTESLVIIDDSIHYADRGTELEVQYKIRIEKKQVDQLPLLFVDKNEIPHLTDRHINVGIGTACLCGPIEEAEFVKKKVVLPEFIIELVIPFLYSQAYFDKYKKWPWKEYNHGSMGILESYIKYNDPKFAPICINRLKTSNDWQKIKFLLAQKKHIKGHISCICPNPDQIRRCHPDIWVALNKLRSDVAKLNLNLD